MYAMKSKFNTFIKEGYVSKNAMTLTLELTPKRIEKAFKDFKDSHMMVSYRRRLTPVGFIDDMDKEMSDKSF